VDDSHFVQMWKLQSRHRFCRILHVEWACCPTDRGFFMFFLVWTPHEFFSQAGLHLGAQPSQKVW
jgi:hypothetical protein